MLASEVRLASFLAICKGDVNRDHWFSLCRDKVTMENSRGLVSWNGTFFEYMMPLLVLKNFPNSLLDETYKAIVNWQFEYCSRNKVPIGITESQYYGFDQSDAFQYKAFSIPGISLNKNYLTELVISPHSAIFAVLIDEIRGMKNMHSLINKNMEGKYGFYEALDYTQYHIPAGEKYKVVKSYMVHHKGMTLMAIDNIINDDILAVRLHSLPMISNNEDLLKEDIENGKEELPKEDELVFNKYNTGNTEIPEINLLSNGNYSLMIANNGSGYAKNEDN